MLEQQPHGELDSAVPPGGLRYSFVVPIYQDEGLAADFCASFQQAISDYAGETDISGVAELIFVQDGGSESTTEVLREVCDRNRFAKLVTLSRNFGQHIALSCGYRHSSGHYVGMLNVDQEDPPDQIPRLLQVIEQGHADIVYSLRTVRSSPLHITSSSHLFNWLLNKATGFEMPLNTGTLRVMRRSAVDAMNALPERSRFLPGLEMWLGLRSDFVEIAHRPRSEGRSSYTMGSRLRLGFNAIISFSDTPLRLVTMAGALIALLGFALAGFLVLAQLSTDYRPGYTSTMVAIVVLGGVQICVIGLASLYIGRILTETQRRPLYVVRERYKIEGVQQP